MDESDAAADLALARQLILAACASGNAGALSERLDGVSAALSAELQTEIGAARKTLELLEERQSQAAALDAGFRVLLLDQRGTGSSTPVTAQTLRGVGDADAQAAYLEHFRADSIVKDCEVVRKQRACASSAALGAHRLVRFRDRVRVRVRVKVTVRVRVRA